MFQSADLLIYGILQMYMFIYYLGLKISCIYFVRNSGGRAGKICVCMQSHTYLFQVEQKTEARILGTLKIN